VTTSPPLRGGRVGGAVGELEARLELPAADPAREERQTARLRALATESGPDADVAEQFLSLVIDEVIRHHEHLRGRAGTQPHSWYRHLTA